MSVTIGLNCPACGGAIQVAEGDTALNCQYCGSTLFIEGDAGVYTIAFKNKIDRNGAVTAVTRWFKKGWKARDLQQTMRMGEIFPIYIPFWNEKIRVVGWVCGYEERHHSDGKGHTRTERVPKEVQVLTEYHFSEIACDPGDLGVRELRNFSGESSFEDFEMIPTYEATTSRDDAKARMEARAVNEARQGANVPNITFQKLHLLPKPLSMIYYPIWVVRYSYHDRTYLSTVDGVTGAVISGRAPGDALFQSLAITIGTSVGGLIGAAGLALGSNVEGDPMFAVGGLIIGGAVLFLSYRFFRHGSEITEGDFSDKPFGFVGVKELKQVGELLTKGGSLQGGMIE